MVDERELRKQYSYKATSNLVIEHERPRKRDQDGVGVSAWQAGELPGQMGDKVARKGERPDELQRRLYKNRQKETDPSLQMSNPESNEPVETNLDVVDVAEELEINADSTAYAPTNAVSKRAFEALLAFVSTKLGDQPRDLLRSAADETLFSLKDKTLTELDRKTSAESILGRMNVDEFSRLSLIGRQISDYEPEPLTQSAEHLSGEGQNNTGDDIGVSVVYDADDDNIQDPAGLDEDVDGFVEVDPEVDPLFTDKGLMSFGETRDNVGPHSAPETEGPSVPQSSPALDPRSIDAYWIQRQLNQYYSDAHECQLVAEQVFRIISSDDLDQVCEHDLVKLLQFDKFEFVILLLDHRETIVWCTKLSRAQSTEEKNKVRHEMNETEKGHALLQFLFPDESQSDLNPQSGNNIEDQNAQAPFSSSGPRKDFEEHSSIQMTNANSLRKIDLESIAFQRGNHLVTSRDAKLPEGSEHFENLNYEEWHIPATQVSYQTSPALVAINELPPWAQPAFPATDQLNRVQSAVFPCAFESDENMLVCAPTGAGKTNIAMLSILRAFKDTLSQENPSYSKRSKLSAKVVYVAPMKALVSEVVGNLTRRLAPLDLNVRELTGDVSLSRHDISEAQVIVTTPEKWDIITRKGDEKVMARHVKLLIVDEIHLLHDERGPVLESLVARTLRDMDLMSLSTRIVGLSATLPNYKDVATFLRVEAPNLFHFGPAYRPCPLQQCYVGITVKKAIKRFHIMNEITFDKVKEQLQGSKQTIVFVHSRKETTATARFLIDKAISDEIIDLFLRPGSGSSEIIRTELPGVESKELASVLEHGVAIHHAGMTRSDRSLVEALFEARHVKVLVSTATLAWGVNLPAHAVIVKGTQVYSPEHGRWIQLSSMDVMQMMGRAGRPQFDKFGEGIIITTKSDVLFYLSLLNDQLPIESHLVSRLVDTLNAEICNGNVPSISDGVEWLSLTYLYVRMANSPALYNIPVDSHHSETALKHYCTELVHSAALELHEAGLVRYNKKSGSFQGTAIGKVASDFYVSHKSMSLYLDMLKRCNSDIDILRTFSCSGEFRYIHIREEEKLELVRLSERVPVPVKESLEDSTAKVNVLLQAHISNLGLDVLALKADMVYITQSAARLSRAMLHIAIHLKNTMLVDKCLSLSKCVSNRQWSTQSPLRQFQRSLGRDVIQRIERKDYPFERYFDLTVSELGELLKNPKLGKSVHRFIHMLPRLEMDVRMRPLSRSLVEVELSLLPDFHYNRKIHGTGELFWIWIEDCDSEHLLHIEPFFLKASLASEEHVLLIHLPISIPNPPHYFIQCRSDRWVAPENVVPISFRNLLLPEKFSPPTKLLGLHPSDVGEAFSNWISNDESERDHRMARDEVLADVRAYFHSHGTCFSSLQTQLFPVIFGSDDDFVLATIPGQERNMCVELCMARVFVNNPAAVALLVLGRGGLISDYVSKSLEEGIAKALNLRVVRFTAESNESANLLRLSGTVAVTTADQWDMFSRRWREKRIGKILKKIGLIIFDDIHLLGTASLSGAALEIVASRMRYIASDAKENGDTPFRIAAFSDPVANARDFGHWLGCSPSSVFSFHPRDVVRGLKLEVVPAVRGFSNASQIVSLSRPVYSAIRRCVSSKGNQALVYTPSELDAKQLAKEIFCLARMTNEALRSNVENYAEIVSSVLGITDKDLKETCLQGIGFLHGGLNGKDQDVVFLLFRRKFINILFTTTSTAWRYEGLDVQLVVIAGTKGEMSLGTTKRDEYSRTDMIRMMYGTRSSLSLEKTSIVVLTSQALTDYYKNFLIEPFPIESQLPCWLSDHLNSEIISGVVESKQDAVDYLTWTFFYRRLPQNPSYYGMGGVSHLDISNHLSELVETAISDLEASKCIATEGEDDIALGPLNLGIIAAHYYLRHATVEYFASSMSANIRLNRILDILTMASEFESVIVKKDEEEILQKLAMDLRIPVDSEGPPSFSSPHVKAHILLQSQMSRQDLPPQLMQDRNKAVVLGVHLLRALVDVVASAGWLKPVISTIEMSQMLVQGVWDSDPVLMQIPHIDRERATLLKDKFEVSDIFAFLEMEDEARNEVLRGLSTEQVMEVANACQLFPNLEDVEVDHVEEIHDEDESSITRLVVKVRRNEEYDENEDGGKSVKVPQVVAPHFAGRKDEGWWLIVGDEKSNRVFTVKHIALKQESNVKLEFLSPPVPGTHSLKLYLMSDAYIDCDQEESFEITVSGGMQARSDTIYPLGASEAQSKPQEE